LKKIFKDADVAIAGNLKVFEDRHFLEHGRRLKFSANAAPGDRGFANTRNVFVVQPDLTLGR